MLDSRRLGTVLLGIGLGILLLRLFPLLAPWWPLGLIIAGLMFWRGVWGQERLLLLALSLTMALVDPSLGFLSTPVSSGSVVASYESTSAQARAFQDVKTVIISNSVGRIEARGGSSLKISVEYRRNRPAGDALVIPQDLQLAYDEDLGILRVTGIDPQTPESQRRGLAARLHLELPAEVSLQVNNGVGDIVVTDLASAKLQTAVGDVSIKRLAGDLEASTQTGEIELEDVLGRVEVSSSVGDIDLSFSQVLTAPVSARADVGDISLSLPNDSDVELSAISQLRDFSGDFDQITASEARLRLGSGTYNVDLRTSVGEIKLRRR